MDRYVLWIYDTEQKMWWKPSGTYNHQGVVYALENKIKKSKSKCILKIAKLNDESWINYVGSNILN